MSLMSLRRVAIPLAVTLSVVACSGAQVQESPNPARPTVESTTTTSTLPPTTTTVTGLEVEGAPASLSDVVSGFYAYATGQTDDAPPMSSGILSSVTPTQGEAPLTGTASLAEFGGQQIGVVEATSDVFLVVEDGSGWTIVGGTWPSIGVPAYFGRGPRHVAVVGSDARPGQTVDRSRADSIHFVGLDGDGGGAVVGLPRDSYVEVPGLGRMKVTGSLARGGPETMMATFEAMTGLDFEGYVLTGFDGFEQMLGSVLGGVSLEIPYSINDRWAKVNLEAGIQMLNGAQALGFARARKTVPGGDLTRSEHQGVILLAAASTVKALGYSAIPGLLEASEPHMITDMTPEQLLTFSAMAISADLESVANVVAPGRTGTAGGASVVFLNDSVSSLWEDLADGHLDG